MIRRIIQIDQEKCNGCGACAAACHEDAIAMVDGKAQLMRDDYCDGLGDCLPACPTGAISMADLDTQLDQQPVFDYCVDKVSVKEELVDQTVKGSQFREPLLEFSGSCAGCAEST